MSDVLLCVEHVSRAFHSRNRKSREPLRAVDDVSLALTPGTCLGLVGESGSGKSTLGKLVLALLRPDTGRVLFEGEDLASLSREALRRRRQRMALIPQNPLAALDPRMRIGEQVAEPLTFHRIPRAERVDRLERVLAATGLDTGHADRFPHQISGGQRQRAVIARALILEPSLIVLDEPVSALDVSIQAQILTLLAGLQAETNTAYLFITHDLRVVRQIADEVAVMQEGQIVEAGSTDAVIGAPSHHYTRGLLAAVPRIPGMDGPLAATGRAGVATWA